MKWFLRGCLGLLLTMIWSWKFAVWMEVRYGWDGWNCWGMGDIKWQMLMEVGVEDKDDVECGGYGWGEGGRYG